jgi:putative toxin-antitoxin system antitoxin component (TIGR02293 family)
MGKKLMRRKAGLSKGERRPSQAPLALHAGDGHAREPGIYRNEDPHPSQQRRGFEENTRPVDLADIVRREIGKASSGERAEFEILDDLLSHGFSRDELFDLVVPRRTFARRKQANDKLSAEESDRAVRLARLTAMAERIFGEAEKAHRWLRKPSRTLAGAVPLNLMKTETGAHLVEQTLHRIDYGMLA